MGNTVTKTVTRSESVRPPGSERQGGEHDFEIHCKMHPDGSVDTEEVYQLKTLFWHIESAARKYTFLRTDTDPLQETLECMVDALAAHARQTGQEPYDSTRLHQGTTVGL